jgi:hypothetical protein
MSTPTIVNGSATTPEQTIAAPPDAIPNTLFKKGDSVLLFKGPNVYRTGTFAALRKDSKWADIEEHDGILRPHPVEWLKHKKKGVIEIGF